MLAEMALHGLGQVLAFHKFHQPDLRRLIAIFVGMLELRDHAWAGLQHRHRMHITLVVEDLGHTNLFP